MHTQVTQRHAISWRLSQNRAKYLRLERTCLHYVLRRVVFVFLSARCSRPPLHGEGNGDDANVKGEGWKWIVKSTSRRCISNNQSYQSSFLSPSPSSDDNTASFSRHARCVRASSQKPETRSREDLWQHASSRSFRCVHLGEERAHHPFHFLSTSPPCIA